MPPKEKDVDSIPATTTLALPDWLKLLTARGVDMRVAMALAGKIYKSHGTKERLSTLDAKKLTPLIPDKDQRKTVVNAVKGIASGSTPTKKRTRDSDLLEPLKNNDIDENLPTSLEFHEILEPEALIPVTITTNRAPVKTAWAYTVARQLGFDQQESLSIAHVYVHFSSLKHALMLGNILNPQETREAEEEIRELPGVDKEALREGKGKGRMWGNAKEGERGGSSQPWVGILRARVPVIERPDGTWRAIQQGVVVVPSVAYKYITKAFKDYTPQIMGAMKLVAATYEPEELNRMGMYMYNEFKPDVVEWGQRGILECAKILDQANGPVNAVPPELDSREAGTSTEISTALTLSKPPNPLKPVKSGEIPLDDDDHDSELSDPPDPVEVETRGVEADEVGETPLKKRKKESEMTLEEYEAMLDLEDQAGGFLEAVDIANIK